MIDNTDIVPSRWIPVRRSSSTGDRIYKCVDCGAQTPPLRNGRELRDHVKQEHLCLQRGR